MKSSGRFYENTRLGESVNQKTLGRAQWALIHGLESEYRGKKVHGTTCKFEDNVWHGGDGTSDYARVNWKAALDSCGEALVIFAKIISFEMLVTSRLELSTLKIKVYALLNSIIGLIKEKKLLAGDSGDSLLGLNHISENDLLVMLDERLASASSEKAFVQVCSEVSQFLALANHLAESVPLFEIRAQLPWEKAGLNIQAWANRRAADVGETFRTVKGYSPLVSETAIPLIERSIYIVDELGDHFKELGRLVRGYKCGQKYSGPPAEELLKKYGPVLRDVVAPPDIEGLPSTDRKRIVTFIWIRQLAYLARGACINIILLTSGLRNSDIRDLRVGACKPSGRVDMLFYLRADIKKTNNVVILPVPPQAQKAVTLLEELKFTESCYLIDGVRFQSGHYHKHLLDEDAKLVQNGSLNILLRDFAAHFNIPFFDRITSELYSAHNYRTTVAGWLDAHSNLSVLLVRRLFGHGNDVMPTTYLRNNPAFIQARREQKEQAAAETAKQMALAASHGRLAGVKGDQLLRGYQAHGSRLEGDPTKSHSLTDVELVLSFSKIIEQRIVNGSVCGFLTPFGVRCMRNPADSSQPPCARRSHRDKTREITEEVLQHLNDIDPANCIGTSCDQAMVGPWSEPLKESLLWYAGLVRHQHGEEFNNEEFIAHAKAFIKQYSQPIRKVFHIQVLPDGSVCHEDGTKR